MKKYVIHMKCVCQWLQNNAKLDKQKNTKVCYKKCEEIYKVN